MPTESLVAPLLANSRTQEDAAQPSSKCDLHKACFLNDGQEVALEQKKVQRKLLAACILAALFMVAEVVGGYMAHSVAIMSDAAHMLSDVAGFGMALLASYAVTWRSHHSYSFGYHRAEIIGALFSTLVIWAVTGALVWQAVQRVITPEPVDGKIMFIVASAGVLFNIVLSVILGSHHVHGLSGECHGHGHDHEHGHDHGHAHGHGQSHGHGQRASKQPNGHQGHRHRHHEHDVEHGHVHNGHNHHHDSSASSDSSDSSHHHEHHHDHKHHNHTPVVQQQQPGINKAGGAAGKPPLHPPTHAQAATPVMSLDGRPSPPMTHPFMRSDSPFLPGPPGPPQTPSAALPVSQHASTSPPPAPAAAQPLTAATEAALAATKGSPPHKRKHRGGSGHAHAQQPHAHHAHGKGCQGHAHTHDNHHAHTHERDHEHDHSHHGHAHHASHDHAAHGHHDHHAHAHHGHSHANMNLRSAIIHTIGDLLQSIGVAIAGALIWYHQDDPRWVIADPICTFIFALLVLLTTRSIIQDIMHTLMERTPGQHDIVEMLDAMHQIEGVQDVHDLHVWNLSMGIPIMTAHVHAADNAATEQVLKRLEAFARSRGIQHSTVQICNPPNITLQQSRSQLLDNLDELVDSMTRDEAVGQARQQQQHSHTGPCNHQH